MTYDTLAAELAEKDFDELYSDIQEKQRKLILECCILDSKIKDTVDLSQPIIFEQPGTHRSCYQLG